ncbi:sensor histidine kinase [Palleronia sp.]|uniref:sensor histidine kinase n=1 Tax=Palleronia sp. TaxID=1940284 RepID=UPI0035C7F3FF
MQHARACARPQPVAVQLDDLGVPAVILTRAEDGMFSFSHMNAPFRAVLAEASMDGASSLPPPLARRLTAQAHVALTTGGPVTRDLRLSASGKDLWWRITLRPFAPDRLIGTAVNVADLKVLSFRQSEEIARQTETISLTRSMAGLTIHDIRAPLANLVSLSDMMLDELQDHDDSRELAETCAAVARSALQSVDTLMERLSTADPLVPRIEVVPFGDLCRDVAALVDPSHRLEIVFPEALVEADAAILLVGLRNLLDNAVRYADRVVEVFLDTGPGDACLSFVVADDGPGFGKGRNPLSHDEGGLRTDGRGYGLGAVLRLVGGVGGTVTPLPPRIGRGATVQITLPGRVVCVGAARSSA